MRLALLSRRNGSVLAGVTLVAPATLAIVGVLAIPIGYALWVSLVDFQPILGGGDFVGLRNYQSVLLDESFRGAIGHTLYFAVPAVLLGLLLGFWMAVVVHQTFPGRGVVRALVILPWTLGSIVTGLIWGWIFNSSLGVLNRSLEALGLIHDPVGWLASPTLSPLIIAIVFAWANAPIAAMLFLSALQSIPVEIERAAQVDGANGLHRLIYITIPLLQPTILVAMLVLTIDAFMTFGLIYVLTAGGPGQATTILSWLGYLTSFSYFNFGEGTAIFFLLSAFLVALGVLYRGLLTRGQERVRL